MRRPLTAAGLIILLAAFTSCGTRSPHHGRLPFSLTENPPSGKGQGMRMVARNDDPGTPSEAEAIAQIRPGDVIAFHMSHREAWSYLRRGSIQKIPYELLRYGHIALAVPSSGKSNIRLLQIAMKQAANTDESTPYLRGKRWIVFRPPGTVNQRKLLEFCRRVTITAGDPRRAYDYVGTLGLRNAPYQPEHLPEIGAKYTCATLVVAALHYSDCPMHAVHRNGWFDIVTPAQVVDSHQKQPGAGK